MSVRIAVASTHNVNVHYPGRSIDSFVLRPGDVVLLWQQIDPAENGLWVWIGSDQSMIDGLTVNTSVKPLDGAQHAERTFILHEGTWTQVANYAY